MNGRVSVDSCVKNQECLIMILMMMLVNWKGQWIACQTFSDSSSGDDDVFALPTSEPSVRTLDRQLSSDTQMTDEDPMSVRTCSVLEISLPLYLIFLLTLIVFLL